MRTYQYQIITAGSMATNLTSKTFQLENMFGAAVSCVVTNGSSPSGTLTIQGSVDDINFTPLKNNGTNVTLTVTGNGTYIFDVTQTSVQYLNVTYTAISGSGQLNAIVYSKGF